MNRTKQKQSLEICDFCRKDRSQVRKLIAGPEVYICNECVDISVDIIAEDRETAGEDAIGRVKLASELVGPLNIKRYITDASESIGSSIVAALDKPIKEWESGAREFYVDLVNRSYLRGLEDGTEGNPLRLKIDADSDKTQQDTLRSLEQAFIRGASVYSDKSLFAVPPQLDAIQSCLFAVHDCAGIYFLIDGIEIVYVGESGQSVAARVASHKGNGKVFTCAVFCPVFVNRVEIEAVLIRLLDPKYNKTYVDVPPYWSGMTLDDAMSVLAKKGQTREAAN